MKKIAANITIISIVALCIVVLSCYITLFFDDARNTYPSASAPIEQYFEGNLYYTSNGAFFEEAISEAVIPVDVAETDRIIGSKLEQICKKEGLPVYVKLSGCLSSQFKDNETSAVYLTVKKIKKINGSKHRIKPMIGTYNGNGQTLTISPNHTFTFQNKSGDEIGGNWFLNSGNTMVLQSKDSKMMMRVNYRKKSLNSLEDSPTIFMLSSTPSSH